MVARVFKWWLLTVREEDYQGRDNALSDSIQYIRGQLEVGEGGFRHWQICVCLREKRGLNFVRELFGGTAHCEPSRSDAAREYVWKEDTRVEGTQFERGELPMRRASKQDWEEVWQKAKEGKFEEIPSQVRICNYNNLRRIASDYGSAVGMERSCVLYWGRTGSGKSRRAWNEAGMDAYPKDPRTKFWDGYRGEEHVVLDEFRGNIDIAHMLRWLDRYPVRVEIKGSSTPLRVRKIWITSNLPLESWYTDIDPLTLEALQRRIEVIEMQ